MTNGEARALEREFNETVAMEREACAQLAEEPYEFTSTEASSIADAIRARSNT